MPAMCFGQNTTDIQHKSSVSKHVFPFHPIIQWTCASFKVDAKALCYLLLAQIMQIDVTLVGEKNREAD